ncbi:amino acid ABC transporter ATP-binding protein [Oceanivirga miroungae]|uniref:amino acid ABC transporter ATP-binding protein n=1 Tax=Oceanivirga miroungae TaxID=1130046 RepID=UPI0022B1F66C|nr:amino acid ABC transporter ATP-binding protein [Oceanivirga miroungae]
MLEIKDLVKTYGNRTVLDGINLTVKEKEVISILGSSGSGKSTLLRCINLLEEPTQAKIYFHNKDIIKNHTKPEEYRQKVGMVFQNFNLFDNLTVLDNCTISPIKILGIDKEKATKKAIHYLKKVGMDRFINARPKHLSGGQKQRVAIARALCMEPEILLFDEPTSALDPEMVTEVLNTMTDLAKDGMTMLVVTHEMNFARDVSTRVIFLDQGKIIEDNNSHDFFYNQQNERIKEFIK